MSHVGGVKGFRSAEKEIPWTGLSPCAACSPCTPCACSSPSQWEREASRFGASAGSFSEAPQEQRNLADVAGLQ